MGEAFAWLGQLFEWFGQFIPRWTIIRTTHGGIKWVRGQRVVELTPGWHMYWPLTTDFIMYPTARQATDLPTQTMETSDGITIVVGVMLAYEVVSLTKLVAQTYDPDQTIHDIAAGAIHDVCAKRAWKVLKTENVEHLLRREVAKRLRPYGVRIIATTFTTLAKARVLKVLQRSSQEGT